MSNETEDIGVRIVVDYAKALKDIQAFTGAAGKEFSGLPRIVQQVSSSIDALTGRLDKMGSSAGPRELQHDLNQLPGVVAQISRSIDSLHAKVDTLGNGSGVKRLNDDLTQSNKLASALGMAFKGIGAGMAGWQAGKMVFLPHMERMLDYDTKLAHLSNVAFAGQSVSQRIAGKAELNSVILGATRAGGGTRDEALETYQKLVGSGAVTDKDARTMLPSIMRSATASGASADQIADIGIRSMQNFGFKASDLPKVIDMAIKSGNLGGFELKDMAKWLPAQMAEAATIGMKGEKGLAQLLALNQASITTAGSTDAAGNNVVNLLNKINSHDTQLDFKKQGINLTGSLSAAIGKGIDPVTAFAHLIDTVMGKDKNYQALEKKRKSLAPGKEQDDILEKQLQLAEGTAIGKVLQDRQARGAYLGFKKQGDTYKNQIDEVLKNSAGTTQGNFDVLASSPGFKRQQSLNDQLNAQNEAMQKLVPALNSVWEGTSRLAREYPLMTTAVEGGKIAVTTLAAGAGAASIVMTLLTKNAAGAAAALGAVPVASGAGAAVPAAAAAAVGSVMPGVVAGTVAAGGVLATLAATNTVASNADYFKTSIGDDGLAANIMLASQEGPDKTAKADDADKISKALQDSIKFNPIEAKLQLQVAFDEIGRPYVSKTNMTGTNMRLDTGPTLTH